MLARAAGACTLYPAFGDDELWHRAANELGIGESPDAAIARAAVAASASVASRWPHD